LPLQRLTLEALQLAEFVERHWEPRRQGRTELPGLRSAAGAVALTREAARDLRDLAVAIFPMDHKIKLVGTEKERSR
jgi:hypothetical protein